MEGIGQFDQTDGSAIPLYNKRGRLLMEKERRDIADRRGQCFSCGVSTHARKGMLGKKPLSNENVYCGICIRCNPKKVPPHIYNAWAASKNRPLMSATVTAVPAGGLLLATSSGQGSSGMVQGHPSHARTISSGSAGSCGTNTSNLYLSPPPTSKSGINQARLTPHSTPPHQPHRPHLNGTGGSVPARSFPPADSHSSSSIGQVQQRGPTLPDTSSRMHVRRGQDSASRFTDNTSRPREMNSGPATSSRSVDMAVSNHGLSGCPVNMVEQCGFYTADSSRSMDSVQTTESSYGSNSRQSHPGEQLESFSESDDPATPFETEKAALGIKRTAPATKPGVQSVNKLDYSSEERSEEYKLQKDAAVGQPKQTPQSSPATLNSLAVNEFAEPQAAVQCKNMFDEKAAYRLAGPASRPGVQVQSYGAVMLSPHHRNKADGDQRENGTLSAPATNIRLVDRDDGSLGSASKSTPKALGSADLKMTLQDSYKGDETKLSTNEYIKQLGESLDDPAKLRHILHNLRNIESEDQIDCLLTMKEILPYCAADPRVADAAAGVIWRTAAASNSAKVAVMRSGVVDVLLNFLRDQDDHDYCQWALGALTSITLNTENKEIIAEKSGIQIILAVMSRHNKFAGIFEWGCRSLHNLVYSYDEEGAYADQAVPPKNIALADGSGGIGIIVHAMSQHVGENTAQLWAMKLLWRLLAWTGSNEPRRRIGVMHRVFVIRKLAEADFISLASKLLRQQTTSGDLQRLTAELMTAVILGSGGETNKVKIALMLEKATECVPNMIRAMKLSLDDEEVQSAGCRLLSALSNSGGEIPVYLIEQGAINAIASAMIKLRDDGAIIEAGTWALWKLSAEWKESKNELPLYLPTVLVVLKVLGAVAAKHHGKYIQEAVYGFVVNVSGIEGIQFSDFPICDFASGFFHNPTSGASQFFAFLFSQYPQYSSKVMESLDLARVVRTLNDSGSKTSKLLCPILVVAAGSSAEARSLLVSSGILSASVAVLRDVQDKEEIMFLLDLILVLCQAEARRKDVPPRGFCQAIKDCLEGPASSDDALSINTLRSATGMLIQSASTNEAKELLPVLVRRVRSSAASVLQRIEACNLLWTITAKNLIDDPTLLDELLSAVLGFMVRFNGDGGFELNMDVQSAAAGALIGIMYSIRSCPIPVEATQVDTFMASVYKSLPLGDRAKDFMIRILVTIWQLCFVHQTTLLEAGVIILVIDIMTAFAHDPEVQENCSMVLAQLASSETIHITLSIVETDGVQFLLEAMNAFPSERGVQREAARTLSHLSTDDETRMLVSALGGTNLLVKAITTFSNDNDLIKSAYAALVNLTSDTPEQFLDFPATVRAIVRTMVLHPDSTTYCDGLGILQNLCVKGPTAKETVAAEGGVSTVVDAMKKFITAPLVMERGFSTLWSLALLPNIQGRIARANGIDIVISGMYAQIEYERVELKGCGCIYSLSLDPYNRTELRDAGGPDAVILASKAHFGSPEVQTEVCRALSGLSTPGEGRYQVSSISQDEVDTVIFAMQHFQNVEGVQVNGSTALVNFLSAKNASLIASANKDIMTEAINKAAGKFPSCSDIAYQFSQQIQRLV